MLTDKTTPTHCPFELDVNVSRRKVDIIVDIISFGLAKATEGI